MLPKIFKPKYEYKLIRYGKDNDGGYLVEENSIFQSNSLISLGLGHDWSFEKDYYKANKKPIYCYDHSVSYSSIKKYSFKSLGSYFFRVFKPKYLFRKEFFSNMFYDIFLFNNYKKFFKNNVKHFQYKIGPGKNGTNLNYIFNKKNIETPTFLKIDIEGSEYRILDELIKFQNNLTGIVIEFHDFDIHINRIIKFVESFEMDLVHIHPQNPAPLNDENIPTQLEISFSKNPNKISNNPKIPHELDQPANPNFDEIDLKFFND
ncbi:FkbM family methyltransferase [Candidatus Pelagibacter sp.]|nr:FkbM family methyltransferase [Candidatus Pelagibacter sp.]